MVSPKSKIALVLCAITIIAALSQYNNSPDESIPSGRPLIRHRLQEDVSAVTSITLIGERHSGTNWITDHLNECFGDDLQVRVLFVN
jgi:hypothetical protein